MELEPGLGSNQSQGFVTQDVAGNDEEQEYGGLAVPQKSNKRDSHDPDLRSDGLIADDIVFVEDEETGESPETVEGSNSRL